MAGPQPDRPLLATAWLQVDMHQTWGSGHGGLPAQLGCGTGADAETGAVGHWAAENHDLAILTASQAPLVAAMKLCLGLGGN